MLFTLITFAAELSAVGCSETLADQEGIWYPLPFSVPGGGAFAMEEYVNLSLRSINDHRARAAPAIISTLPPLGT